MCTTWNSSKTEFEICEKQKKKPIETASPASIHPAIRLIGYPVSTP